MRLHVRNGRVHHVRGFTLIETLLVVALFGILVSLLLPSLGRAKAGAQDAVSLSNMRSHAQVLAAYAGDWNDYVPAITYPRATLSVIRGGGEVHTVPYFHAAYLWNIALADAYYEGQARLPSFEHPGFREVETTFNSYLLTASYMADPAYWNAQTRLNDGSQLGHSRLSHTVFASSKVLLTEWHPRDGLPFVRSDEHADWLMGFAFADGRANRTRPSELVRPYPFGDGGEQPGFLPIGVYGMHTVDGWRGRDQK